MNRYHLYGYTLATDHRLASFLASSDEEPDLVFVCKASAEEAPASQELVYRSVLPGFGNESLFSFFRLDDGAFRLYYPRTADFVIRRDRIECRLFDPQYAYWVEIALLGPVLSFWLELRGSIALHAAAVVVAGEGVGFIAASKAGKSSLAATFMAAGAALLADDILPLDRAVTGEIMARPAFPQLRMWPDQVRAFAGDPADFPLAHPEYDKRRVPASAVGGFHGQPVRLGALFLPERAAPMAHSDGEVYPIGGRDAFMTLLQASFAATVVEHIPDMQARRLSVVGDIVRRVPVYRLSYPDGFDRLPDVRSLITRALTQRVDCNAPAPAPN
jgi:hypothetical protein